MHTLGSLTLVRMNLNSVCKRFITDVTVIGAGLMGSGIAQVAAQTGHSVVLVDVSESILEKSRNNIQVSLTKIAKKRFLGNDEDMKQYVSKAMGNLKTSTDAVQAVQSTDMVVEAIVENLEAKQKLFSNLDKAAPHHTIFVSNTSSLSIRDISLTSDRKDRFGGLHFFIPVPLMKLLEVIRIAETSEDTYERMMEFGKQLGKQTITCKDTPGFVVNRLLGPYLSEALKMLERGDATTRDIDLAMKLGASYVIGPFELLDYIGLDTHHFITNEWKKKFPEDPIVYHQSRIIKKLISEGKYGKKTGEGFYKYEK